MVDAALSSGETRTGGGSTAKRSPLLPFSVALPAGYSLAFFIAPLISFVLLGFWTVENYQIVASFSLANYIDISKHIFSRSSYGIAIAQSLYVSVTTAIWAVALCYALVLAIVYAVPARLQRLVLLLAIAPFWTSY